MRSATCGYALITRLAGGPLNITPNLLVKSKLVTLIAFRGFFEDEFRVRSEKGLPGGSSTWIQNETEQSDASRPSNNG